MYNVSLPATENRTNLCAMWFSLQQKTKGQTTCNVIFFYHREQEGKFCQMLLFRPQRKRGQMMYNVLLPITESKSMWKVILSATENKRTREMWFLLSQKNSNKQTKMQQQEDKLHTMWFFLPQKSIGQIVWNVILSATHTARRHITFGVSFCNWEDEDVLYIMCNVTFPFTENRK